MWYAGVDWANDHHDTLVIDEAGHQVASLRVTHSKEGLAQMISFLLEIVNTAGVPNAKDQMACIVETSHGLLIAALLDAGFAVYPINPKIVDRRRKPSGAKTDAIDAYLLAKTGRSELQDLHRLTADSAIVHELKILTRDQDTLIQTQTRLVNQLTSCLKEYYPVALTLFCKLHQPLTLAFLQAYPTPQQACAASVEELELLLKAARHPKAHQQAQHIWHVLHQPHLTAEAVTTRAKSCLMLALVSQLIPLIQQIAAYTKQINRLFVTHEDSKIFTSLPGAGKRLAPRLLVGFGDDRERYRGCESVQALAGTSPVTFASGNYSKAHKRYACIKPFRNAMHQFAWQSTLTEAWANAYYQRKRAEGKSHTIAVRALANVWVRIIYAMWCKKECYQPETFLAAQQVHSRQAA